MPLARPLNIVLTIVTSFLFLIVSVAIEQTAETTRATRDLAELFKALGICSIFGAIFGVVINFTMGLRMLISGRRSSAAASGNPSSNERQISIRAPGGKGELFVEFALGMFVALVYALMIGALVTRWSMVAAFPMFAFVAVIALLCIGACFTLNMLRNPFKSLRGARLLQKNLQRGIIINAAGIKFLWPLYSWRFANLKADSEGYVSIPWGSVQSIVVQPSISGLVRALTPFVGGRMLIFRSDKLLPIVIDRRYFAENTESEILSGVHEHFSGKGRAQGCVQKAPAN